MKAKQIALISRIILITFGLIIISGCMTTTGEKKYYQLYLPPDSGGKGTPAANIDYVLLVEKVEVEDIYNDYRVVYRTSPYQLNYYSYHFWIKKPEKIVRDAITDYLSKGKYFKGIITEFSGGMPDLMLKASVHMIEEYDRAEAWLARLKMDIEIKDFKARKRVLLHSFDRHISMPAKNVAQLPIFISRILKEELDSVIKQLEEKLRKK
ncbi:MAG: hypothetical protein GTO45_09840 [Candidatus Aminicenantes bacterium]|nr:hypothetical protein [Candidatus Aminicenantes bacterium]NIM79109.1 hypothetical protein [Candidatus Aminicenantes bacterium]NIN18394.1 hypothetical protein [Candidatus Aminicenantes bacterium]NIN42282.1 hypothetical protein [Candidatus Aminicenantes bacterium]NIN85048.1 hypothetical protein [Candidatus Aminicenantes bacterium]